MGWKHQWQVAQRGLTHARLVKQIHGVSYLQQAQELMALRKNNLGIDDYYIYRVYDPVRNPTRADKETYTGWRVATEFRRFSEQRLQAIAYEKHIFYRLCESFGLPAPRIYAVYAPKDTGFERHRALRNLDDLRQYLSTTQDLPVFGKPSSANDGYGARAIVSREEDGKFKLINGKSVTLDELVEDIDRIAHEQGTYLLVEFLRNSDSMQELAGETVASIRLVMLVRKGEPEFFKSSILVPGVNSQVSNVRGFVDGTVSCGINNDTGKIFLAVASAGLDARPVEKHPSTGVQLLGRQIDGWEQLKNVAMEASRALSPFRMQHWDFAMTQRGPVILEMNFIGGLGSCQLHGPPGLLTEEYRSFRASHMY